MNSTDHALTARVIVRLAIDAAESDEQAHRLETYIREAIESLNAFRALLGDSESTETYRQQVDKVIDMLLTAIAT